MQDLFAGIHSGSSAFCVVQGDIGAGKSTLLREFVSGIERTHTQAVVAWGHCDLQTGKGRPLLPWTGILESLAGTSEIVVPQEQVQDASGVLAKARSAFTELAPDIVELLLPGVGLVIRSARLISRKTNLTQRLSGSGGSADPQQVGSDRRQLEDQYVAVLEKVMDESPLVLVIDDLHCADTASLDLLARVAAKTKDRPLFLLIGCRSEGEVALNAALRSAEAKDRLTAVDLDQAMRERGRDLVEHYVRETVPGVSPGFVDSLTRHTGGHPLFLVELVDHLINREQLIEDSGHWQDSAAIDWDALPDQVQKVLAAQLEGLPEAVREALHVASVEGDQFTVEVVAGVLEERAIDVVRLLDRQAPKNLVEPLGSFSLGNRRTTRFRFCHSMAHRHVYESIPNLEQPYLHETCAIQLEALAGEATDAVGAQLAHHYDRAGRADLAVPWYGRAAEFAESTGALIEAIDHLRRGFVLGGEQSVSMRARLAGLLNVVGELEEAEQIWTEVVSRVEEQDDANLPGYLVGWAHALNRLHRFDEAASAAGRALATADEDGLRAQARDAMSLICDKRGQTQASLEHARASLELCQGLDDEALEGSAHYRCGWAQKELGQFDEARGSLSRCVEIASGETPNWHLLASAHNALADLEISQERYPQARVHLETAVDAWRQFDAHSDVAVALNNLANVANREGLYGEALDYGREAYKADLRVLGDGHAELAFALTCIGESQIGLRNLDAAIETLGEAYDLRTSREVRAGNRAWTAWLLGRALVEDDREPARGFALVDEARAVFEDMGDAAGSELKDVEAWLRQMT